MGVDLLLDTGAFVALLDEDETMHGACVAALEKWDGPIVTTEAVLTETMHLVGDSLETQQRCLTFFLRGICILFPSTTSSLTRVAKLMKKYRALPMDFADATLVTLAEELATNHVFTIDRRGFSVYRVKGRTPFQIIP